MGPTWPSKPHSKRNLAPLGSIFGALATLRIELSPARELDFVVFAILSFKMAFQAQLASSWAQLGASWAHLGLNLELLGASWAQLGVS